MIEICISTFEDRIIKAFDVLERQQKGVRYLIIHQVPESKSWNYESYHILSRNDVRLITTPTKGLAISRNIALLNTCSEIFVPTDDDIKINKGAIENIRKAFKDNVNADIITFQSLDTEFKNRRKYKTRQFKHNRISIMSVSSIEVACRTDSLKRSGTKWDEDFGLGQKFPGALEIAFLSNALKNKLDVEYFPYPIAIHPTESSGSVYDENTAFVRGAAFHKVFNIKSIPISVIFVFRKKAHIGSLRRQWIYLLRMVQGIYVHKYK